MDWSYWLRIRIWIEGQEQESVIDVEDCPELEVGRYLRGVAVGVNRGVI